METMNEKLKQFAQAAMQAATGGKSASQKYFQGTKKGKWDDDVCYMRLFAIA
jgi:hypothetical protein